MPGIPRGSMLSDLRELSEGEYSLVRFESVIERIRQGVAKEMISLIVGEQNLIKELEKINDYLLMIKGDFYHHFLEEAKILETISSKEKQQRKLNDTCLPNTFMRLGTFEDVKRVSFEIKPLGVDYKADELKIGIRAKGSKEEEVVKVDAPRIRKYLNLEMARASVGFISCITDFNSKAEVEKWHMECKPYSYYGDLWSDLSLKLKMDWPINLILTPDLMECFSRINKFLFPLRQTQIDLERLFKRIPQRIKEHSTHGATPS